MDGIWEEGFEGWYRAEVEVEVEGNDVEPIGKRAAAAAARSQAVRRLILSR